MGCGVLFVKQLTGEELELLQRLLRHVQSSRMRDRYQAIWFSHLGKSVQEIAELLKVSEESVRRWFHIFEEGKMEGYEFPVKKGKNLFASP
jgi:transposase